MLATLTLEGVIRAVLVGVEVGGLGFLRANLIGLIGTRR